jgi:hypothetical protein
MAAAVRSVVIDEAVTDFIRESESGWRSVAGGSCWSETGFGGTRSDAIRSATDCCVLPAKLASTCTSCRSSTADLFIDVIAGAGAAATVASSERSAPSGCC